MQFTVRNPLDEGWYADPEARYYEGKYIIYVTHSLPFDDQHNHSCFVSEDLTHWEKIENIIDMEGFPWAKCAIWAPTIEEKNGKYYYIFASNDIHSDDEPGGLEIAVSDRPEGPFHAFIEGPLVGEFHNGAQPIDAHLFKDEDGTVYLYWGGWRHCNVCRMKEDMTGLYPLPDGEYFREVTPDDYVEAPCMMKKGGVYYFMWSAGDWTRGTYRVNYATASSPLGPFEGAVRILSAQPPLAEGPGHHGYLELDSGEVLIVYHRRTVGDTVPHHRRLCIDRMQIEDGRILPVVMTEGSTL
jgi:beta-xylosidase